MTRTHRLQDGEWIRPRRRGFVLLCCDCALAHRIDFRIRSTSKALARAGVVLDIRLSRDARTTALARRRKDLAYIPRRHGRSS